MDRHEAMSKLPRKVYLDNHATTPVDPQVLKAMLPFLQGSFGNAASRTHFFGWEAEDAVEKARKQVADIIGADVSEIVWTSGATESINLALRGTAYWLHEKGRRIVTIATEHKAVLHTLETLEQDGYQIVHVPVKKDGSIDLDRLFDAADPKLGTTIISVMFANNEIGTIYPIMEIGKWAKKNGVIFHVDAAQAVGKLEIDVDKMGIDLLSMSAHKLYAPKGVGALYIRSRKPRVKPQALIYGGGHEGGFRSGTLNVPGIVGFGEACRIAKSNMLEEFKEIGALRDKLEREVTAQLECVFVNGKASPRLPGNSNMSFAFVEGESLLMHLNENGIAVSTGSACSSAQLEPSHVLKAIGVPDELVHSSMRFGIGRFNTEEEIDYTIGVVVKSVKKLREMSPLYEMYKKGELAVNY